MACLRRAALEGRSRIVFRDEEGCQLRPLAPPCFEGDDGDTPAADCVLQLRLRAGDSEDTMPGLLGNGAHRNFKIYRTEFPAIFRFNGQLYQEFYDIDGM